MLRGFYAIVDLGPSAPQPSRSSGCGYALELAEALLGAQPCMLQLRAKAASAAELFDLGLALASLCRDRGVPFCVNDRLDVALAVGADAVHLGQEDLPLAAALQVLQGREKRLLVGISTHNLAQATSAVAAGADYIGFGPVFPTRSKRNPDPVVGLNALAEVCRAVATPVVAIGGINLAMVDVVAQTGAAAAAVISAVLQAPDPRQAAAQVVAAFARPGEPTVSRSGR